MWKTTMENETRSNNFGPGSDFNENTNGGFSSPEYSPQSKLENIPLQSRKAVKRQSCLSEVDGLKVIIVCFVAFTVALTIAMIVQIYYGEPQVVPHGSVATDSKMCSIIGTKVLQKGGNAVDAAIASTICMGVVHPHVTGLGGGGFMAIHDHRKTFTKIIDFRETAPAAATPDNYTVDPILARLGGLAVGVPGLLRGLEHAHKQYGSGKVPWKDLILYSATLARDGFPVSKPLAEAVTTKLTSAELKGNIHLLRLLRPGGVLLTEGQHINRPDLAMLLQQVALSGTEVFYDGVFSREIVNEVRNAAGVLSVEDLRKYTSLEHDALTTVFNNYRVFTSAAPSGGPQLLLLLNMLQGFNFTADDSYTQDADTLHKMSESIRLSDQQQSQLGDPDFVPSVANVTSMMLNKSQAEALRETISSNSILPPIRIPTVPEPVASQVAVIDNYDLYVSVVSSVNSWFGSKVMTSSGVLLNNVMANFYPAAASNSSSGRNVVVSGRRPLTAAAPAVVVDADSVCGTRMVLGAADSSLVAEVLLNLLVSRESLSVGIEEPRIVPDPGSTVITLEDDHTQLLSASVRANLTAMGHKLTSGRKPYPSINAVQKIVDELVSHSDSRGGGVASRF